MQRKDISAMQALKTACQPKTFQSFKTLQTGEHIIRRFSIVTTTHGPRIRLDFDETYMYLPERFIQMLSPEAIEKLNESPKIMIYSGKDHENRDR